MGVWKGRPISSWRAMALGVHLLKTRLNNLRLSWAGSFFFFQDLVMSLLCVLSVERIISPVHVTSPWCLFFFFSSSLPYTTE